MFKRWIKNLCQVPTSYSNKHEDIEPKIQQKRSASDIDIHPQYEDASETVDLDAIWGVEDRIMCEDNNYFVPIKDSDVIPGIDADNDESKNDENEEVNDGADVKNNYATLDDEDGGIIMHDGHIEYDEFNIPITVGNSRMGGRHTVFGFYR